MCQNVALCGNGLVTILDTVRFKISLLPLTQGPSPIAQSVALRRFQKYFSYIAAAGAPINAFPRVLLLSLSRTSPGFYVSAKQGF